MLHRFRIVFSRSLSDDQEYIEDRIKEARQTKHLSFTEAILAQLQAEIDQNDVFKGRFRFSQVVSLHQDTYYCLGEIDYEGPEGDGEAFDKFMEEFQVCYDEFGMAGHYEVIPSSDQPVLNNRVKTWDMSRYAPQWIVE